MNFVRKVAAAAAAVVAVVDVKLNFAVLKMVNTGTGLHVGRFKKVCVLRRTSQRIECKELLGLRSTNARRPPFEQDAFELSHIQALLLVRRTIQVSKVV